jgi:hypothetical protein
MHVYETTFNNAPLDMIWEILKKRQIVIRLLTTIKNNYLYLISRVISFGPRVGFSVHIFATVYGEDGLFFWTRRSTSNVWVTDNVNDFSELHPFVGGALPKTCVIN